MTALTLSAGLGLLVLGASWLVKGASGLAARAGVPPLVVGLTVVSLGTSAPEVSVSVASALRGNTELALGNVVGSNILNVLLILGVAATITPLAVQRQLIRLDVPVMIGVSALVYFMGLDARIAPLEAALLLVGLVSYVTYQIVQGRREGAAVPLRDPGQRRPRPLLLDAVLFGVGLALLVLGSEMFVRASVTIARSLGVSDLLIGLTVVAVGTSLPELTTSAVASLRGEGDIAVGNVVGSNLFNLLGVLGAAGVVAPEGIPVSQGALGFDLPVMIAVAVACLPVFFSGGTIARWEGMLFLGYYVAYSGYVVLAAADHEAAPLVGLVMLEFVLPITALTLGIVLLRERKPRNHPP